MGRNLNLKPNNILEDLEEVVVEKDENSKLEKYSRVWKNIDGGDDWNGGDHKNAGTRVEYRISPLSTTLRSLSMVVRPLGMMLWPWT